MAELKLLEFLVSLKYYSKQSPRALLLANLCNIIPYAKPLQESFPYNFDLYTQEYFFYIFSKIIIGEASSIIEYNDTQTLLKNEKLDEISKTLLCFAPEIDQKRFLSKLTRLIKKVECPNGEVFEGVDVDKIFDSSIEEFFESKKKKFKTLTKKFSKMYETDNGLLSFDEFKFILSEVSDLPSPLEKYTFANEILKLKCYIYSITSGKNKNDIIYKDFIGSVLKFGMDCPFPFVKNKKKNYNFIQKTEDEKKEEGKVLSRNHTKEDSLIEKSIDGKSFTSLNQGVIESSALFGQHFALLRELKGYCTQFKEAVDKETNTEVLLKHFDNISEILNVACQFFKFPIKI